LADKDNSSIAPVLFLFFIRYAPNSQTSIGVSSKLVDSESHADVGSTHSDASNVSALPPSNRVEGFEDTLSTAVLAGSFSSTLNSVTVVADSPPSQ